MGTECTSATHAIFKVFGYSGNKDCKYHIHFFELDVGGKKKPAKTFLEVKVSETTSNLVMLCAQKIPSQPHLSISLEETYRVWFSAGHRNKIIRVGLGLDDLEKSLPTQPVLLLYDKTPKFTHIPNHGNLPVGKGRQS